MTFYDDKAYTINALIAAVEAIEDELGNLPKGPYATVRTRLDILEARINNPFTPAPNALNPFYIGNTGVSIQTGFGDPNALQVAAIPGSLYLREDGYNIQGLYTFRGDGYWHQIDTDPWIAAGDLAGTAYSQTVIGIQGRPVSATAPQTDLEGDGYVLTWNSTGYWEPQIGFYAAGDLSGNKLSQTIVNLQGTKLVIGTPQDGYAIIWNGITSQWEPQRIAVVFDPLDSNTTNLRSNRYITQSPIDNTQTGIVNFGSRSTGSSTGVTANYSSILGGDQNQVGATYSTVVGGLQNIIGGTSTGAFIGGGQSNTVTGGNSVVVGGDLNTISDMDSFVGTGTTNTISSNGGRNAILVGDTNTIFSISSESVILDGYGNTINASNAVILNGNSNSVFSNNSVILNGTTNNVSGNNSVILNGITNTISGSNSVVLSGTSNIISSNDSTVQGINNTTAFGSNFVTVQGDNNKVGDTGASSYSTICGSNNTVEDGYICLYGYNNTLNQGSAYADVHGSANQVKLAGNNYISIWGQSNTIQTSSEYTAVFGINNRVKSGSYSSFVVGSTNILNANSNYSSAWGLNNTLTAAYSSVWGAGNTVAENSAGYTNVWGNSNLVTGDYTSVYGSNNNIVGSWSSAWGSYNTITGPSNYANVFGYYGAARFQGQFVQSVNTPNATAGAEQYSRIIMDGGAVNGGSFNLAIAGTANPLTLEDGKVYDITIRVLLTQTNVQNGVAASFVFDVLAHQESGTAVLDSVNNTLINPNGTGWSVTISAYNNTLVINVPSYSTTPYNGTRRAVATVEWRELSRL
jgi:hypothetical protein